MSKTTEQRLKDLGIELPSENPPAGNYKPYNIVGNLVYISGQKCKWNGKLAYAGKVGREFSVADGQKAARICGLNILMHLKNACNGDLEKVKQCAKLNIFVHATEDFLEHPLVSNGVSDLMIEIFGEKGRHSRTTTGSASLPEATAVEVDAIFELMSP